MHYPKFLRSNRVRSAVVPAVLLCMSASGCSEQEPTGPGLRSPRVARTDNIPFNKFFIAWSRNYSQSPIETQNFALDARQRSEERRVGKECRSRWTRGHQR